MSGVSCGTPIVDALPSGVMDPLNDLPAESRQEVVAAVQAALRVDKADAELIVRASEPLWEALEQVGGLVDSWGGGDFCYLFPKMCEVIQLGAG
jgi:hypothetical protein